MPWNVRILLALVVAVHFCMGSLLGLSVDEAHYALYAVHWDWSYFDHPPLVGWVQWPLVVLDAPTWLLRLIPELLWLATAVLVYHLAERLESGIADRDRVSLPASMQSSPRAQAGWWAVVAMALAPMLHVLGIGLLPDTLLVFFTVALMGLTLKLMDARAVGRPMPWLALGVLLGLAGLSKYTAILGAAAVALCLILAHGVSILRNGWLWMAVAIALLLITPVAYWNYSNHWISLTYQAQHGVGGGWQVMHLLRFLLLQLLVYGPLLLWGWLGARQSLGCAARSLGFFFTLPFLVFAVLAGGGTSLPHWSAPAWIAMVPFAGIGIARSLRDGRKRLIMGLAVAQAVVCTAVLGLMLTGGVPLVSNAIGQGNSEQPSNAFADLHGWDAAGARARALAAQHGLHSVAVQNWTLASRIAWYARPLPVHVLEDRFDQFDLWAGDLPAGGDALLVDWSQLAYTVPLGAHGFADCSLLDTQDVQRLGTTIASFRFFACHRWAGQPQPQLRGGS